MNKETKREFQHRKNKKSDQNQDRKPNLNKTSQGAEKLYKSELYMPQKKRKKYTKSNEK